MSGFLNFNSAIASQENRLSPSASTLVKEMPKKTASSKQVFQPNMDDMRKVFNEYDTNGAGRISPEEFKLALQVIGSGSTEAAADSEYGDGFVDFQEFVTVFNLGGPRGN